MKASLQPRYELVGHTYGSCIFRRPLLRKRYGHEDLYCTNPDYAYPDDFGYSDWEQICTLYRNELAHGAVISIHTTRRPR